jgi:YVTN family beta-propeller protein
MRRLLFSALLVLTVCAPRVIRREPPPLLDEGELLVYVQPFLEQARRLSFTVAGASAAGGAAAETPLELATGALSSSALPHQRLLAHGRMRAGEYGALLLRVTKASMSGEDGPSSLIVASEPYRVPVSFTIARGRGTVLWLSVRLPESPQGAYAFDPAMLVLQVPPRTVPPLVGYCARGEANLAVVFDKMARLVTDAMPTGRAPADVAIDRSGTRAYISLRLEDAIEIVDVANRASLQRIRLRSGDGPRDVAFAGDGRTLLVLNESSDSLAFVDTVTLAELARVATGDEPRSLIVDRTGRRAFVLNHRGSSLTVVDLATRSALRTLATDPAPVRAAIDRQNSRLYVISEGSAYLSVYALPSLVLEQRLHVGLGARYVTVDPRTDLVYVARGDEPRILVFDPISTVALDRFEIPAPASSMVIDDTESVLFVLMPSLGSIAAVDLTSRRTLALFDTGPAPSSFMVAGERH